MDSISKIICDDLNLRAYTVTSLKAVRAITAIHKTTPNATVALGRTINAAALMSAGLKSGSDQTISVRFSGDGPLREVLVQADARGNIRAYVSNPSPALTHPMESISFSKAIGAGFLRVGRELNLQEPYTSLVPLLYGDIASDISYFLTSSDQVPSALILALEMDSDNSISASGGILIQTFPDTPPSSIELVENSVNSMKYPLGQALKEGMDIHQVVSELMGNHPLEIKSAYPLRAGCRCSKDMLKSALSGIQREELRKMIDEDHGAEITCTFCRKIYHFTEKDLVDILNRGTTG
jgi:molecular chaperone Hsp33